MARVYKCPVITWESHQEKFTSRLIDDYGEGVSVGSSKKEAQEQLREYLTFRARNDEYFWLDPDFEEPEIRQVKVRVTPEYVEGLRRYPCKEAITLKLPCAVGKRQSGLFAAHFPTLNVYFDFYAIEQFPELAQHYAKQNLSQLSPRELSRYLPPVSVEFDYLNVTIKDPPPTAEKTDDHENLLKIADPIGKRTQGRISRAWERDRESGELSRLLTQDGVSVCIVGSSGCGKSSVLVEAARRVEREVGADSSKPRFWLSSAARIIAGMRYLGQWEERLEAAIQELRNLRGVLCVENLLDLLRAGGQGPESGLASFLVPYIRSGELRLVAEATPSELEAADRQLPGLIDEMQTLTIEPFDERRAVAVLGHAADYFAQNEKIQFPRAAAEEVHHLFRRFQPYVAFPGKAIQLMTSAADQQLLEGKAEVSTNDVRREFSSQSGLPELFLREDLPLDYDQLVAEISAKLFGQTEAVGQICRTIAKFKAGLNDPNRPLGVLLFCGPTGVGKTQLVKLLGDFLFASKPEKDRLIRLDMSEYSGHDAAERLLGNVLGRPSELIRAVRANPFSIILLDEIEKAAPDVFDMLLNVFEEGRLTDPLGRLTNFNSSILVMTSNLGTSSSGSVGFGAGSTDEEAPPVFTDPSAVREFFRPEFFNRIDHIVFFNALGKSTIVEITRLELAQISKREGFKERGVELEFSEKLVEAVASEGFDPVYGARPLQRAIEEKVVMPLARKLAGGEKLEGKVKLDWDAEEAAVVVAE
ncbi:MAG: ATP-dependent Clp protease ATP-binding subunit ClpC [Verrucomicrobiales bacterium]|jgi:ATP-dependent Clp protease ATP-binding subunit ClpC